MSKVFIQIILLSALVFGCVSVSDVHTNRPTDVAQPKSPAINAGTLSENQICENQHIFGELFARTELFFGSSKPDGSTVTDEEFERFLEREITPRFPDGCQYKVNMSPLMQSKNVTCR